MTHDESLALSIECASEEPDLRECHDMRAPAIPDYLEETYWWAYLRPRAVWLFEREWLVNLILWGNMRRLTEAVLGSLDPDLPGPVLQMACVYGDFSNRLASSLAARGRNLHILDIAPIQLTNAQQKLQHLGNVSLHHQDASAMHFPDHRFAQTVLFFLLHEQPEDIRRRTVAEAIRVTRPGGRVVVVDYHRPHALNPLRYVMRPVLKWLEPFAMDLWTESVQAYLPAGIRHEEVQMEVYCQGLYQKIVVPC